MNSHITPNNLKAPFPWTPGTRGSPREYAALPHTLESSNPFLLCVDLITLATQANPHHYEQLHYPTSNKLSKIHILARPSNDRVSQVLLASQGRPPGG